VIVTIGDSPGARAIAFTCCTSGVSFWLLKIQTLIQALVRLAIDGLQIARTRVCAFGDRRREGGGRQQPQSEARTERLEDASL